MSLKYNTQKQEESAMHVQHPEICVVLCYTQDQTSKYPCKYRHITDALCPCFAVLSFRFQIGLCEADFALSKIHVGFNL